jgi:hypothetical protein
MIRGRPINKARPGGNVLRGIFLLARGRKAGIAEFANTQDALSASLAPLIAFPLVGAGIIALGGHPELGVIALLSRLCGVLALPVITHAYAKWMGREASWLRTATALNWSFWVLIPMLFTAALIGAGLVTAGLPNIRAEEIVIFLTCAYMLWLHWFTVRIGLDLSSGKAIGLVILSNIAIGLLTFGPDLTDLIVKKAGAL